MAVQRAPGGLVTRMPEANVMGPGRDRRLLLPQYFATVDGHRTAFFDAGKGRPFIFVHGLAGNATHWVNIAPWLSERARVVGIDAWGCGESERPDEYSIRRYTEQVVGLMDVLGIETATVVGHSLGGMVATLCAYRFPHRVDAAVLVNPAGLMPMPRAVRMAGHAVLRERLLARILPRVWRTILDNVFYDDNEYTRAFIRSVDETMCVDDIHDLARQMDRLRPDLLDRNYGDLLPRIRVPTHVIWGEKDRLVPARWLRRASKQLPNVSCEEIPRCGHMPIIERPDRLIALLGEILESSSSQESPPSP